MSVALIQDPLFRYKKENVYFLDTTGSFHAEVYKDKHPLARIIMIFSVDKAANVHSDLSVRFTSLFKRKKYGYFFEGDLSDMKKAIFDFCLSTKDPRHANRIKMAIGDPTQYDFLYVVPHYSVTAYMVKDGIATVSNTAPNNVVASCKYLASTVNVDSIDEWTCLVHDLDEKLEKEHNMRLNTLDKLSTEIVKLQNAGGVEKVLEVTEERDRANKLLEQAMEESKEKDNVIMGLQDELRGLRHIEYSNYIDRMFSYIAIVFAFIALVVFYFVSPDENLDLEYHKKFW